jgi:cell division protein FtsB
MSDSYPGDPETGGVGTMPRPAGPLQVPPRRPAGPRRAGGRPAPGASPRRLGESGAPLGDSEAPRGDFGGEAHRGRNRMPFFLLLCVLLGGALICTLVISTTLAAGSYQITNLQQANQALARQRQTLEEQVAQAQSAQVIQQRALRLGMREAGEVQFLDLKTGQVETDAGSGSVQNINVPGYTP